MRTNNTYEEEVLGVILNLLIIQNPTWRSEKNLSVFNTTIDDFTICVTDAGHKGAYFRYPEKYVVQISGPAVNIRSFGAKQYCLPHKLWCEARRQFKKQEQVRRESRKEETESAKQINLTTLLSWATRRMHKSNT
jgi:hypothetical protein